MYSLGIKSHFHAAHCIKGHPGPCARLHGHRWEIEARIAQREVNDLGMALDFSHLRAIVDLATSRFDHHYLNDVPPFDTINPTAELLAREIFRQLRPEVEKVGAELLQVTVWESPEAWAAYSPMAGE